MKKRYIFGALIVAILGFGMWGARASYRPASWNIAEATANLSPADANLYARGIKRIRAHHGSIDQLAVYQVVQQQYDLEQAARDRVADAAEAQAEKKREAQVKLGQALVDARAADQQADENMRNYGHP